MDEALGEPDISIFRKTEKARFSLSKAVMEGRFSHEQESFLAYTLSSFCINDQGKRAVFSSLLIDVAEERDPIKFNQGIKMIRKYLTTIGNLDDVVKRMDHLFKLKESNKFVDNSSKRRGLN